MGGMITLGAMHMPRVTELFHSVLFVDVPFKDGTYALKDIIVCYVLNCLYIYLWE